MSKAIAHLKRNGAHSNAYKAKTRNKFITQRFVDYERSETKRARHQKRALNHLNKELKHSKRVSLSPTKVKEGTFSANNHNRLQSKRCHDICTENVRKHNKKANKSKRKSITEFKRKRSQYIAKMVHEMFNEKYIETECNSMNKSMNGRDKMVLKSKINKKSLNEWMVNVDELNIKRDKNKNNVIIGVQIMDKKRSITVYSNEKGMIFKNRKYIKRGLKIKSKWQMVLKIEWNEEKERIEIDFVYLKEGKLVQIDRKPIVIQDLNGFEYGVNANIFIAQNENVKYGKYTINKTL